MFRASIFILVSALALPAFAADAAAAPDAKASKLDSILKAYTVDLAVPDSPGLLIVGLSSESVIRPTTPRKLGMAVLQGRNEDGTPKQGFALDFAPAKLFDPGMSKEEYRDSPMVARPLWNSQISVGVGQPLSDTDKSSRIGLGLSTVLWRSEKSDPLRNPEHSACLSKALAADLPDRPDVASISAGSPDPAASAPKAAAAPAKPASAAPDSPPKTTLKECRDQLAKDTWNPTALMFGWATSRVSGRDPAVLPDGSPKGYWLSFNYGFENIPSLQKFLQFTVSYRRLREEIIADPNDKTKFVSQDSNLVGTKLYGRTDIANLFIEASRKRSTIVGRDSERANLFVFGAERKITDNMWLTLAMGSKRGGTATNPTYVTTGIKFGYEDAASIKP